jgi:hypothetical protein
MKNTFSLNAMLFSSISILLTRAPLKYEQTICLLSFPFITSPCLRAEQKRHRPFPYLHPAGCNGFFMTSQVIRPD